MTAEMKIPKKLIEVALPLDDINAAAKREKSIRHGHPSTLHLWWARRPLAAARAVLFAQLVNDPGYQRELGFGVNKKEAEIKREYLFQVIRDLVKWENTNNEEVLNRARKVIWESWRETCHLNRRHPQSAELFDPDKLPAFHDPFAGGGSIPLEAQRLGLEAYASDLNPVAVMINKAMIEIPPKFRGQKPVGPLPKGEKEQKAVEDWTGAKGLAEDVRRYGHWVRDEASKRIGHLYPKVKITPEMVIDRPDLKGYESQEVTVIAWLWARTVKSPSPAFSHVDVPLITSYVLSSKKGSETYIQPVIEGDQYRFEIKTESIPQDAKNGTKIGRGGNFQCLISNVPIPVAEIRKQGQAGTLRQRLMAVVAESKLGRIYLNPTREMEKIAYLAEPAWRPESEISHNPRDIRAQLYGLNRFCDLFTSRQLMALTTFSDLIQKTREKVIDDAKFTLMKCSNDEIDADDKEATAYGDAVATYLALSVGRSASYWSSLTTWTDNFIGQTFGRQAIRMVWDYAEGNPFSFSTGNWIGAIEWIVKCLDYAIPAIEKGVVEQVDAQRQTITERKIVSTDPPYYDNIIYADLSDFFYVWLRRALRSFYPKLFATMATPKSEELVVADHRHDTKMNAEIFFIDGMANSIHNIAEQAHPVFPVTIYYAFKQIETKEGDAVSKGWVNFLDAVISAGFTIDGTWPMRTERDQGLKSNTNVLASSIVLVCRKRSNVIEIVSRRDFQRQLREEMPEALETMIGGETGRTPIAPVDLAQAAIGPGMAIFSKYEAVLNQDGSKMSVHDALILINRSITDYLSPESGNFDSDTQFCSSWFEQHGWSKGPFGEADTLSRAKGTSVDGIKESGVLESGGGKVRLLKWLEYESACDIIKSSLPPPPPPPPNLEGLPLYSLAA